MTFPANTPTTVDPFYLFGSSKPWNPPPWTTKDDRLRGGSSLSHLTPLPNNAVRFSGNLDITTLGGAGFASQFSPLNPNEPDTESRTAAGRGWDLSAYEGVEVAYAGGDGKTYTLILKDDLPSLEEGKRDDGRERAGVSWEAGFVAEEGEEGEEGENERRVWVPWGAFRATYRGREMDGHDGGGRELRLKTEGVKRVGVMMRSGFGKQKGGFGVELRWICARRKPPPEDGGVRAGL